MITETSTVVYRVLSLGAGTQSSVLALLLSRSDPRLVEFGYPKPDAAVFADTGWEPSYVYHHLDWLEKQLDYPLIRVSQGNLRTNLRQGRTVSGHRFVDVPFFTVDKDGKKGMLRRQCTTHYKIKPIYRQIRKRAGGQRRRRFPKNTHVEMWLGISLDESRPNETEPGTVGQASLAAGGHPHVAPGLHRVVYLRVSGTPSATLGMRHMSVSVRRTLA